MTSHPHAALTKEQWMERAIAHFMNRAALDAQFARECAEACYENHDPEDTPEESVDEELSCWTDDGDDE